MTMTPKVESIGPYLEPLRKSIRVRCGVHAAFRVFTERIGDWWPLAGGYSVFGADAETCRIEPAPGGAILEIARDGRQSVWGRVIDWEPPHRVSFSWHPGRTEDTAQTVELRFTGDGAETQVELEHRDWQKLGDQAAPMREGYSAGWDAVLAIYAGAAQEE